MAHLSNCVCFRLEIQVLERFEQESGGELLVATLSLLEVSARGLLETELLEMLADYENLMPREDGAEKRKTCWDFPWDLKFMSVTVKKTLLLHTTAVHSDTRGAFVCFPGRPGQLSKTV